MEQSLHYLSHGLGDRAAHNSAPFLLPYPILRTLHQPSPAVLNSSPGIAIEFFTAHLDATLEAAVLGGHSIRELPGTELMYLSSSHGCPI